MKPKVIFFGICNRSHFILYSLFLVFPYLCSYTLDGFGYPSPVNTPEMQQFLQFFPGCLEKSQPFMLPAPFGHRASSHVSQSHSVLSKMLLDGVFFVSFSLCACSWFDSIFVFLISFYCLI